MVKVRSARQLPYPPVVEVLQSGRQIDHRLSEKRPHHPRLVREAGAMIFRIALLFLLAICLSAQSPVYVILWFDTEDYIEPTADDAALRIATDLSSMGVRATFKV